MAILFPTAPAIGQKYIFGSTTWEWSGSAWLLQPKPVILPIASNLILGGIKAGESLAVAPDGTLTVSSIPSTKVSDFTEAVQDAVAGLLGAGSNITLTYNDATNSFTIASSGVAFDPEATRDAIGAALVGVGVVTVNINDALDTITLSITESPTKRFVSDAEKALWKNVFTFAEYNALQAADKFGQKTIRDIAANIPAATVFPTGVLIQEIDTGVERFGDSVKQYSQLEGLYIDLKTRFVTKQVAEEAGKLRILNTYTSDYSKLHRVWDSKIMNEPALVKFADTGSITLTSGRDVGVWVYEEEGFTLTALGIYMRTQGVFTAGARNGLLVYKYDEALKTAALVGQTADTPGLFANVALAFVETPLAVNYVMTPGWYFYALRWEASATTTAPQISGKTFSNSNQSIIKTFPAFYSQNTASQASINLVGITQSGGVMPWICGIKL